jgi:pantoate--beta-alanine ligase
MSMRTFATVKEVKSAIRAARNKGKTVGFVPTMGALHEGHLTLVRRSVQENGLTVCSIFVNPIQFNNPSDLEKYPRTLVEDSRMLEEAGCDILFAPTVEEMYPGGKSKDPGVEFGMLDKVLEGKFRPGHFKGVAIVVHTLFTIINADKAYFGKKDYQQLLVIIHLVKSLEMPVEIIPVDTVREEDGLAMSSRNMRLTIGERRIAPLIYHVLLKVKEKAGTIPVKDLKNWASKKINENPSFNVEYFEIVDKETLMPVENWKNRKNALACAAVFLGDVRLIDNMELFY